MNKMIHLRLKKAFQWFSCQFALTGAGLSCLLLISGCNQNVVYHRSVSELNQKAQAYMQQGDYGRAVSRFEAAYELMPSASYTLFNLAVAYKENGNLDESIASFEKLLATENPDEKNPEAEKLDRAKLYQSLGVVHEEKAEQFLSQAEGMPVPVPVACRISTTEQEDATPRKVPPQEAAALKQEAIAHYQKAQENYRALLEKQPGAAGVQAHIEQLDKQIEKLQADITGN